MESSSTNFEETPKKLVTEPGYDYVREIARGGYGHVYLYSRNNGKEHVAGKFVYRDIFGQSDDPAGGAAYERACEGLQNFRSLSAESEYLLRIFDVRLRHDEGYFCYMMELADDLNTGRRIDTSVYRPRTLKNELERSGQRRRLPAKQCVDIAIKLARGLDILHASGFAHRDLRPSNIIFVNDVPKIADIDLLAGESGALVSYIPRGYAAPEGNHTGKADIYSFGKTLYEMYTGLPVKAYPTLPRDFRHWEEHRLALRLNEIVAKACARDLSERYESAKRMLEDLEVLGRGGEGK